MTELYCCCATKMKCEEKSQEKHMKYKIEQIFLCNYIDPTNMFYYIFSGMTTGSKACLGQAGGLVTLANIENNLLSSIQCLVSGDRRSVDVRIRCRDHEHPLDGLGAHKACFLGTFISMEMQVSISCQNLGLKIAYSEAI